MSAATFYTIADARYFPARSLLNSLRLTGHDQELVVLDEGLTADQRARLDPLMRLVELPEGRLGHPALAKPYPHLLDPTGVVTLIDSDIIVTRSLAPALADAAAGKIAAYRDHETTEARWFAEWEEGFELLGPPRRQTYVNAGFVAFSQERWPDFLTRWRKACARIRSTASGCCRAGSPGYCDRARALLGRRPGRPQRDPDGGGRHGGTRGPAHPRGARLARRGRDRRPRDARVPLRGKPAALLHFSLAPKPWDPKGWKRVRRNAYVELLPRLLFASDLALRLDPQEVVRGFVPAEAQPSRASVSVG